MRRGERQLGDQVDAALNETGSIAAKPSGGSISPLEAHAAVLLGLIAKQPDLTLDEIVAAMHKRRIAGSRTAVWRFFRRHNISLKKTLHAAEQKRADVARARRRWMREQGMLDPARLVFIELRFHVTGIRSSLELAVAPAGAWPAEPVDVAQPARRRMLARTPRVLVACSRVFRAA